MGGATEASDGEAFVASSEFGSGFKLGLEALVCFVVVAVIV